MGSRCGCISAPPESVHPQPNTVQRRSKTSSHTPTSIRNGHSQPNDVAKDRFSLTPKHLTLSGIFRTTTSNYQHIELIDDNHDVFLFDADTDAIPAVRYTVHQTVDMLLCGYIRSFSCSCPVDVDPSLMLVRRLCHRYFCVGGDESVSSSSMSTIEHIKSLSSFSSIIRGVNEELKLLELLRGHWQSDNNHQRFALPLIHLQLLYRASKDGGVDRDGQRQLTSNALHRKCDHKGKTLLLIRSENGQVFGAFSSIAYATVQTEKKFYDRNAFLFSLTGTHGNGKIFGLNRDGVKLGMVNLYHHPMHDDILMHFGSTDLIIRKQGCTENVNQCVPFSFNFNVSELIGSGHDNGYFRIDELEVFKVYGM